MAQVLELFQNLAKFYSRHLTREQVDEFFDSVESVQESKQAFDTERTKKPNGTNDNDSSSGDDSDEDSDDSSDDDFSSENDSSDDEQDVRNITSFDKLPIVKYAVENSQVISILLELCSAIRELRASNSGYDNTYDSWDRVITVSPRDQYLTFIYTLLRLAPAEPTSKIYRKLTLVSAQAYILSLTIPGSKGYHIFDDKMIEQAIDIFHLIDNVKEPNVGNKISSSDLTELWVNLTNFCDDLKIMFRYVHFEEYKDIKNAIIWELTKQLYNNHSNGYANTYAATLHSKCFEIFEEIANAHNGDPEETLMKIMKCTCCLHVFPPKPKRPKIFSASFDSSQFNEHISDWFVTIINKSPRIVTKILKHFIEYVVTNQLKGEKDEKARYLDYATKYDAALYTKCNESNLDFLLKAAYADEVYIRTNAVEILTRIILIESKVNWEVFRHEISLVPREVHAIKELFVKLLDVNNSIKLKALNGLQQASTKGTPDAVKIMGEGLKFASFDDTDVNLPEEPRVRFREIRYERPVPAEPNYTFEGHDLLKEEFSKLPNVLYYLFKNNTAHVRRGALLLLETAVLKNPLVIYKTKFVQETSRLGSDASLEVRKQALQMIDSILNHFPNCHPVIYAWSQIIVPLFKDSDPKLIDNAWECFKRRVFDNIRGIDSSNQAAHFMPWAILRVLLTTQQRHFLQACILESMNKKLLNPKVLTLIESHTLTSNSTEAWILLSFIAGKMRCKDADSLISSFIKSTLEQSWNAGQNLQIILEVLTIWINEFSHSALNMAFSCVVNLMKSGSIPPSIISKAFNFCMAIAAKSDDNKNVGKKMPTANAKRKSKVQIKWMKEIHTTAEQYLLENMNEFHENRPVLMSYLFSYSEVNLELFIRPDPKIVRFVHKYLEEYIDTPDNDLYPEDVIFLNQMVILAGRFSIRDTSIANITCLLYRMILKKTERPTTVSNIIVCITDLCKKHTQTVELALAEIITKLRSPYVEIRLITFKNLAQMVLQDLVKLRGNLLLSLMAVLLDKDRELSNRATEFFFTYLETKNSILFQTCLLECPFVYNGYLEFEGFESFSPAEMQVESPLKGEDNATQRQLLYKAFMSEQEEVNLLMFFENLKLIYSKIIKEPSINSKEGHSTIKDMLFIIKEICYQTYPKSNQSQQPSDDQNDADDEMPLQGSTTTAANESQSKENPNSRKRKFMPTINQALSLVEKMICLIPKIADHILKWDRSFQQPIDDLAVAVCSRFENLAEFAQPQSFWGQYKKKAKALGTPSKKRKSAQAKSMETDSEEENEEEMSKKTRDDESTSQSASENPISLLFKPLLV